MIRESAASKTVRLYRATQFPWEWVIDTVLFRNMQAADPTVLQQDGLFWLFANLSCDGGSTMDDLHLFYAENIRGPWKPHPQNPIQSDIRKSRPAGGLFRVGERLYRPAQNASISYGRSITINEVETLSTTHYREKTVVELEPEWIGNKSLRTHTLSMTERTIVTDGLHYVTK